MSGITDDTRRAITQRLEAERDRRAEALTGADTALYNEMDNKVGYSFSPSEAEKGSELAKIFEMLDGGCKPGEIFMKYPALLKALIPERFIDDFLYYADKTNRFQSNKSWYRPTVRFTTYYDHMCSMLYSLKPHRSETIALWALSGGLDAVFSGKAKDEETDYFFSQTSNNRVVAGIIAARIDKGDKALEDAVYDNITNAGGTVTYTVIHAAVMTDCGRLHEALCKLLLAAKLQEGVRQAICETCDSGIPEAFMRVYDTVIKNDLARYSSVKRAVMTWTGIGAAEIKNAERITAKQLPLIYDVIASGEKRAEYLASEDAVKVYLAIWGEGFYDCDKAINTVINIIKSGTKHQILCASYYLNALQFSYCSARAAEAAIERYSGDPEIMAAYLPFFMSDARSPERLSISQESSPDTRFSPEDAGISSEDAGRLYGLLKNAYKAMPAKEIKYDPFIFPWYSASVSKADFAHALCSLGFYINDSAVHDECCGLVRGLTRSRGQYLRLFAYNPVREAQYEALLAGIADREEFTRKTAAALADKTEWRQKDYIVLEGLLRYKAGDMRTTVVSQLMRQDDGALAETVRRLLSSKNEEMRAGGLDILLNLSRDEKRGKLFEEIKDGVSVIAEPTQKELIIIEQLTGGAKDGSGKTRENGYGLYVPGKEPELPEGAEQSDKPDLAEYLGGYYEEAAEIISGLDKLFADNGNLEYKNAGGETRLLSDNLNVVNWDAAEGLDRWPYPELWRDWWKESGHSVKALMLLYFASKDGTPEALDDQLDKLFFGGMGLHRLKSDKLRYNVSTVLSGLASEFVPHEVFFEAYKAVYRGLLKLRPEQLFFIHKRRYFDSQCLDFCFELGVLNLTVKSSSPIGSDSEARELLALKLALRRKIEPVLSGKIQFDIPADAENGKFYDNRDKYHIAGPAEYVQAYRLGLITKQDVFMAIFERTGLSDALDTLGGLACETMRTWQKNRLSNGLGTQEYAGSLLANGSRFRACCEEIYDELLELILPVELNRGDTPTDFSRDIDSIHQISGAEYFVKVLTALGKDTLERTEGWSRDVTRRHVFSKLLSVSVPLAGDTAEKLKKLVKAAKITDKRLVEAAMYAPDWIELVGEVLGWEGFASGCYYFISHMGLMSDEKRGALIARYTPLSREELCAGAFDVKWFEDCCERLGEKRFNELYAAAKYICTGAYHTRARKYADARLGKLDAGVCEKEITDKRNKDTLMAYALIPLSGSGDTLRRYSFIQAFRKQAKQFGAQRRQSETKACDMALRNLAQNAGYDDSMRLTLAMETALTERMASCFEWRDIGGTRVRIAIGESGKCSVECEKNGKPLKSVPAALKKDAYVAELKEASQALNDQYSRARAMFEQSMEDRTEFRTDELGALLKNPVAGPMLSKLVYVCGDGLGFIGDGLPGGERAVRIAHPFDMYSLGRWHDLQKEVFDRQIIQPFKQVFRELYVKTAEEKDRYDTMRFSGNQILPQRTAGALRSRRWIADYEEGLQKVFYRENLIARIYALADWFSPADIEAPTLEWVGFSDRQSGKPVRIADVPDIVFSEVMRDVDLAVSVAHAGGVDPETSHSTVEMRRAVIEFNLPLFGLSNVTLTDTHAVIKGQRADYTVHLGSGVVHRMGGAQIALLPVHSQHRGRLFLPFIDDDPKTAEIMSKIVLFAEDDKLKDPSILSQIK